MFKKIKFTILSLSTFFLFAAPLAVSSVATAAVTQKDINGNLCSGSSGVFTADGSAADCSGDTANTTVNNLVSKVINILSVIVGIVAVIMIIVAGFRYITSGGKQESVTGAKNTILYAVIGLVIVALAQIIVHFILNKTQNATTT